MNVRISIGFRRTVRSSASSSADRFLMTWFSSDCIAALSSVVVSISFEFVVFGVKCSRVASFSHWFADSVVSRIDATFRPRNTSWKTMETGWEYFWSSSFAKICSKRTKIELLRHGSNVRRWIFLGSESDNPEYCKRTDRITFASIKKNCSFNTKKC